MTAANVQQEHALFDKKGEVILHYSNEAIFVEVYRVRLKHIMSAACDDNVTQMGKLIMQVTLFDGKKPTADDVMNLYIEDFNKIAQLISK